MLCAAHPRPSPAREAELARLVAPGVDWPALVDLVERHGVAALVHRHLRNRPCAEVPAEAGDALTRSAHACVAWNLRLRHELGRLLDAFASEGVPVMPLKGPVLADRLYPAPLLRQAGDLDLLVRPADGRSAERILETLGYTRRPENEQGADYHTIFTDRGLDVELHRALGEAHVSGPDVEEVWASASPDRWQGHPIWSMSVADEIVYLAFHAMKDGLASLRMLLDITLLLERHGDGLRWPTLVPRVIAARLAPATFLALSHARSLLDAPVPDDVLEAMRPRHAGWVVAQRLFRWRGGVLHVPDDLLVGPFMAVLMLLWEDTWRARARHLRRNLFPSAPLRRRWTASPASMSRLLWYPMWISRVVGVLVRQLAAGPGGHAARR